MTREYFLGVCTTVVGAMNATNKIKDEWLESTDLVGLDAIGGKIVIKNFGLVPEIGNGYHGYKVVLVFPDEADELAFKLKHGLDQIDTYMGFIAGMDIASGEEFIYKLGSAV